MISDTKIIEIFCNLDDFMKEFQTVLIKNSISESSKVKKRKRKSKMSKSEVMTIMVIFHLKSYRNLKHFYLYYVCKYMDDFFPDLVSYNRFVELQKKVIPPLAVYLKLHGLGKCSGISFIDSTALKVSHYKREKQHKVFKGIAEKSYGTLGWFYGFKLHLVCNDKGQIVDFMITKANVDDRYPLKNKCFHDKIFGKIYGDKGYLGKDLFDKLFVDGIHLVTKLRKNMNKKALDFMDKVYLRKRAIIESVNDVLKNTCQIEHSRHPSFDNFLGNLIAGLTAYSFLESKPSIKIQRFLPNLGIS
ncbi:Transposase IS982 family [Tenacibaculum maritimum]|uniref:IS982 family transposase n=1 Tax=Tenacibaculum maritimum TaxID=107401 RepID=UPI0012E45741|nr:IS982 family transposase [Tenacibaculum maritimum]CAA0221224.1 Transposase IS982 family [Tenacibaculum maritimum]